MSVLPSTSKPIVPPVAPPAPPTQLTASKPTIPPPPPPPPQPQPIPIAYANPSAQIPTNSINQFVDVDLNIFSDSDFDDTISLDAIHIQPLYANIPTISYASSAVTNAIIHPEPVGNFPETPSTPEIYENIDFGQIDFDEVDHVMAQLGVDVRGLARIFEEDETESQM